MVRNVRTQIAAVPLVCVLLLTILVACGSVFQSAKAQQASTTTYSDNFKTDSDLWQYLGSAYRDQANHDLVLTKVLIDDVSGVAFFNYPVSGPFKVSFSYQAGGGSPNNGDGFVMFFYKQPFSTPGTGGSFGFSSAVDSNQTIIPGYGIEFDAWQNIAKDFQNIQGSTIDPSYGDPSPSHIALIKDSAADHLVWANDFRVDDNVWHQVTVDVGISSVTVQVDGCTVITWHGTLDRTYSGFGFCGATGGGYDNDQHLISNFSLAVQDIPQPALTTSCQSSVSQSGLRVQITGDLTCNGVGVSAAPILLSYSVTGGDSWQDLTMVHTASDGSYSAMWMLYVTGDYMIKAVYKGSENYLSTTNIVSFGIETGDEQSVFSVTSNSTLSALSFDASTKVFSFVVSGDTGTEGYVEVFIPKTMLNDTSAVKILIDNNQVDYSVQPQRDGWLLYFSYHHSTHKVELSLGSDATNGGNIIKSSDLKSNSIVGDYIVYIIAAAIVVLAIAITIAFRTWKKNQQTL